MPEVSSTVENDPPATPAITTRAKVVRESFTVLRSDFEPAAPPPVTRPQKQDAAPAARGGQSNVGLSIGGGIVLVGGIFAFLFFGYGSNKSAATSTKPTKATGATSAANTVAVTPDVVKHAEKTRPHEAHSEVQAAPRKTVVNPIAEHHTVPVPMHKEPVGGAAERVAIPRPRELHNLPRESQPIARVTHEKPMVAAPPKPAPHVEAPVHHTEHASHSAPQSSGHSDNSPELDPLHPLGN